MTKYLLVMKGWILSGTDDEADDLLFIVDPESGQIGRPLVDRWEDIVGWSSKGKLQVTLNYHVSDVPVTQDEATEAFLARLYGTSFSGEVESTFGHHYSELTGYLWTDEKLKVGGHDVLNELRSFTGKYVLMNITLHNVRGDLKKRIDRIVDNDFSWGNGYPEYIRRL